MLLHQPSLHLPSLPLLKLVSVLEVIPVAPLLLWAEAPKVLAKDLLKKLPLLKMIKFTELDTTAMLDELSGVPVARGPLKLNLKLMLIMVMEVTTAMVSTGMATAINLHGPQSVVPVSPPNVSAAVASGQLKLNLDTVIMDTPPTVDIMDTPTLEVSPDILPVPLTPTEVSKVLAASKMQ
jgi:hypothetical protein